MLAPVVLGSSRVAVLRINDALVVDHELGGFDSGGDLWPTLGFIDLNGDGLDDLAGLRWSDAAHATIPIAFRNEGGHFAAISAEP